MDVFAGAGSELCLDMRRIPFLKEALEGRINRSSSAEVK